MVKGLTDKGFSLLVVNKSTKFSAIDTQKRPRITASNLKPFPHSAFFQQPLFS